MNVLECRRFESHPIHPAPEVVHVDQTGILGQLTGLVGRHDVDDIALDLVAHLGDDRATLQVDLVDDHVRGVGDHATIEILPGLHEEALLGLNVSVGIEDKNLALGLGLLEIVGHLTGALVRPRGAAVGSLGNGEDIGAAILHGLELCAQSDGLGTGLPRVENRLLGFRIKALNGTEVEVDARRYHEAVVLHVGNLFHRDRLLDGIDLGDFVIQDQNAALAQTAIVALDVIHLARTA